MPLTFKLPPPDDMGDVVSPEPELTQGAIDRFRAQIDAYIDAVVAEQRKQLQNQPPEALRAMLMRGQCLCTTARRLLEQQQ